MASIHPPVERNPSRIPGKQLTAIEPDYKQVIPNATVRRRMSRIVRMGVAAGLQCMAGTPFQPDAILTATGLGCLTDTEKFMNNLLDTDEELLAPTAFIQSTFNTIGAQIALLSGNHGYNNTYVHRAFSFESALLDASLLIAEGDATHILAGAVDELNPTLFHILERFGCWRHSMAGEGSSFFLLSGESTSNSFCILQDIETYSGTFSDDEINKRIRYLLDKNNISDAQIVLPETYKQCVGEYPTIMAFALWYTCQKKDTEYTVLYNSFLDNHSFVLIKQL